MRREHGLPELPAVPCLGSQTVTGIAYGSSGFEICINIVTALHIRPRTNDLHRAYGQNNCMLRQSARGLY